jgi:hypothetical protein
VAYDANQLPVEVVDSVAEGVGFEPTVRFPVRLISSQVPSTSSATLPSIQNQGGEDIVKHSLVDDLVPFCSRAKFRSPANGKR